VVHKFEQGGESIEDKKSKWSHQSPIQSYALRFLEYNCNVSACLSLAEAPPTPERLNDFGILKVPDELSDVIHLALCALDIFFFLYTFLHPVLLYVTCSIRPGTTLVSMRKTCTKFT
jgi:hypothetical protein